ncbi:hypothetical protein SSX86_024679 [Deinandra increscens subsp. villosa]|uniref:MULE transposase domain-containing protein n=1 Tax=Deinandra increscens subsp. villosa TaxID=3103831 RepID=A0AAP0CBZ6_9ASTR
MGDDTMFIRKNAEQEEVEKLYGTKSFPFTPLLLFDEIDCDEIESDDFFPYNAVGFPNLFSIKLQHGGTFTHFPPRRYKKGKIDFIDTIDIDLFSIHELDDVMLRLGCTKKGKAIFYHYLEPGKDLDSGLHALANDSDVVALCKLVPENKLIHIYTEHGSTHKFSTSSSVRVEEIDDDAAVTVNVSSRTKQIPRRLALEFPDQDDVVVNASFHHQFLELGSQDELDLGNVEKQHEVDLGNVEKQHEVDLGNVEKQHEADVGVEPSDHNEVEAPNNEHVGVEPSDHNEVEVESFDNEHVGEGSSNYEDAISDEGSGEYEDIRQGSGDDEDSEFIADEGNIMEEEEVDMRDYEMNVDLDVDDNLRDEEPVLDDVLDNDIFGSGDDSDDNENSIRKQSLKRLKRTNEKEGNFYHGKMFGSKQEAKNMILAHAVESRRVIKFKKDDKDRVRAECRGLLPNFNAGGEGAHSQNPIKESNRENGKVKGPAVKQNKSKGKVKGPAMKENKSKDTIENNKKVSKLKDVETWMVKTYVPHHKCNPTRDVPACTSAYLSQQMLEQIEENPGVPVKAVQEQYQRQLDIKISKMKAYRAKAKAKEMGFKAIGRDLLGLDGAFMKGPFPGQILSAVGIDNNNGIYPVAIAIVEAETLSSWTWFLELLGDDLEIGRNSNFTFVSDRQKGILPAIANLFPCSEHRYCLRHIHENMKEINEDAANWLLQIPPQHWSRAHFSGRAMSDVLLNNMCEVYNGKIVEGRDKPIISALEYIREYLMRRIVTVLKLIEKHEGLQTPFATKHLKKVEKEANRYLVSWNGGEKYQVSGRSGNQCVVDLEQKDKGLHGDKAAAPLESWFHPIYWMESWRKVYNFKLNPINGRAMWVKVDVPTTLTPPTHHKQVGRLRKARKRSAFELEDMTAGGKLSRKNTTVTCGKCKNKGHNSRTCKGQPQQVMPTAG